ncbi:MAG: Acetolactate synthase small subunit [uncultured Chloroflexia bacterium]|uniref:Acetolactate synthase small subunit n=1 Tax=uncultured Chloroflexia bacterium TaxID=1672391 RepID=A0A6J4HVK7_9CHLR|nr:MAG: Acetolactate synthase small subunit [uncultured Chloroflexia bacterium]
MKHTLVALMEDKPGVLNRVVSLFRRRNFNIDSLAVGHTETPSISRMTIVVDSENTLVEQVSKQLYRLIEVLKVSDVTEDPHVARELVLVKVHAPAARRGEISSLAEVFGARIADVAHDSLMLELTASPDKIESFVELVRPFGIKEMVRTGRVAMVRGTPMHAADTYVRVA